MLHLLEKKYVIMRFNALLSGDSLKISHSSVICNVVEIKEKAMGDLIVKTSIALY